MPVLATPRPFTALETLGAIDPAVLVELLQPHQSWLAEHGCVLPAASEAEELDLQDLATALRQVDPSYPEDLIDALATIAEVGVAEQLMAMQRAASRARPPIDITIDDDTAPIDVAARIWLKNPEVLKRVHAEAQIPAVRRFECWRVTEESIPAFSLPEDGAPCLRNMAAQINASLSERLCGGNVCLYPCAVGSMAFFIVVHGATVQRVTTFQEDGRTGVEIFRPAVIDVLRYDPQAGELGIHLGKSSRWLADTYRTAFGLHIFNKAHLFSGQRTYTLLPLCLQGSQVLDCSGYQAFEKVLLIEAEIPVSIRYHYREVHKADDLFAAMALAGKHFTTAMLPTAAKLKFYLTEGGSRTVTLRYPNVAIYQRVDDEDRIGQFLQDRGFVVEEEADDAVA